MKSKIRTLFSFTDSERNGTVVLLILISMVSVIISLQGKFISLPQENFSGFDQFIASVQTTKDNSDSLIAEKEPRNFDTKENSNIPSVSEEAGQHSIYHTKELFNFNPNGLSADDWVRLGLSPAQARCIKNYEAKGGKFESKEDVKKMFVISAERYTELEPFIVLPEKSQNSDSTKKIAYNKSNSTYQKSKVPVVIELNTADTTDLISINGIGPSFARRIVVYRERLGGFHSTEQLKEVFGIDQEKFDAIKNSVKADSSYIRKINVNSAAAPDFVKLPYFTWSTANALVNYRKVHGNFKSVAGIKGCALINEQLYAKITPYLTI